MSSQEQVKTPVEALIAALENLSKIAAAADLALEHLDWLHESGILDETDMEFVEGLRKALGKEERG